jgi:hypothetical protein
MATRTNISGKTSADSDKYNNAVTRANRNSSLANRYGTPASNTGTTSVQKNTAYTNTFSDKGVRKSVPGTVGRTVISKTPANKTTVQKNTAYTTTFSDKGVRKTVNPYSPKRVNPLEISIPGNPPKKKLTATQKKQAKHPSSAGTKKASNSRSDGSASQRTHNGVAIGYGYNQGSKAGGGIGTVSSAGKTTTGGYSVSTGGAFSGSGAVRGGYGQK